MATEKDRQLILITDDSDINRMILSDMLEDTYDIIEADSGKQALEIIDKRKDDIDIILLDFVMPEMDGFETMTLLKKERNSRDIPVIFLTSKNDRDIVTKVLAENPVKYLLKTMQPDALLQSINDYFKGN